MPIVVALASSVDIEALVVVVDEYAVDIAFAENTAGTANAVVVDTVVGVEIVVGLAGPVERTAHADSEFDSQTVGAVH